jgi:hypothetical protein
MTPRTARMDRTGPGQQARRVVFGLTILLLAAVAGCAPRAALPSPSRVTGELQRTALVAFHRMEIGFLQTGSYTTNVLVDLELPRGVKWTLEEFTDRDYRLRFTDDDDPGAAWLVSPAGVAPAGGSPAGAASAPSADA